MKRKNIILIIISIIILLAIVYYFLPSNSKSLNVVKQGYYSDENNKDLKCTTQQ